MEWSEGDNWWLEVDLFPGVTDFKCAVVRQDGSVACWEPGANRTVEVKPCHCTPLAIAINQPHRLLCDSSQLVCSIAFPQEIVANTIYSLSYYTPSPWRHCHVSHVLMVTVPLHSTR